jgi:hypothetical protein
MLVSLEKDGMGKVKEKGPFPNPDAEEKEMLPKYDK